MGKGNIFHKRKEKMAKDLARKKSRRASYERVLVVCEGAKTEPNYLQELVDHLKINTANIEVDGSCGSSPISVVEHSTKRYKQEKHKGDAFDRVFCVFDKNSHSSYQQAEFVNENEIPIKFN